MIDARRAAAGERTCAYWRNAMAGRPAEIRQRDVNNIIRAAKKQGATEVEIRIRGVPVIIHLSTNDEKSVAPEEQIRL
jgi:hypothetical protein